VLSGKPQQPSELPDGPANRLRRDALRILARNFEGTDLSSTEAERLLAGHATLEASLAAVKRQRRRSRRLTRRVREYFVPGIGVRHLRWLVSAVAVSELLLIAFFLFWRGFSIHSWRRLLHLDIVSALYLIATALATLVLAWWWWRLRYASLRSKRGRSSRRS
jgi:hypothetical protein